MDLGPWEKIKIKTLKGIPIRISLTLMLISILLKTVRDSEFVTSPIALTISRKSSFLQYTIKIWSSPSIITSGNNTRKSPPRPLFTKAQLYMGVTLSRDSLKKQTPMKNISRKKITEKLIT